jgi:hypothetical protein
MIRGEADRDVALSAGVFVISRFPEIYSQATRRAAPEAKIFRESCFNGLAEKVI